MRTLTAAEMKGKYGGLSAAPREGTRLRKAYDLLTANPGVLVDLPHKSGRGIADLTDFYGLEIEAVSIGGVKGMPGRGKRMYRLRGEWFGNEYVSYDR